MPGKNGQIAGSGVARYGWNVGTEQPAYDFRGTPPSAIVCAVSELIGGMSVENESGVLSAPPIQTVNYGIRHRTNI